MSFEKAKADLEEKGLGDHIIVLNESSTPPWLTKLRLCPA